MFTLLSIYSEFCARLGCLPCSCHFFQVDFRRDKRRSCWKQKSQVLDLYLVEVLIGQNFKPSSKSALPQCLRIYDGAHSNNLPPHPTNSWERYLHMASQESWYQNILLVNVFSQEFRAEKTIISRLRQTKQTSTKTFK